ncbi:MAG: T9SS type A sorting domain-containing protein [Ignavibacteriaceae bacterium]|nr:T9SS type A sorting domain-containing protein [Ignavibacteriaceae bacterium]
MDSIDITLTEGDVLTVVRNSQSPEDEGDGDIVLGGTHPIKDQESITLRAGQQNNIDGSIESKDGDDPPIGGLFFRPKRSVIAKSLRNVPPGNLEIEINKELVLDYLAVVSNIRTARTRTLNLLGAVHSQQGDVKNLLSSIDHNYAEIFPGESIDFNFQFDYVPTERISFIIKTVGRYETDTTFAFNKLTRTGDEDLIPKENKLFDNYPNPFNPATEIKYSIKENGLVTVKVYDVLGKEVAGLVNEEKPAGEYTVTFDAVNLSSGIYFYTITAKEFQQTKKMLLIK